MKTVKLETEPGLYPIRINRYLKLARICSRRQADRFIKEKQIFINGHPAELGQQVNESDVVKISKKVDSYRNSFLYFLFNKPIEVVSHNPQKDEKSVEDIFKLADKHNLAPVGRLDKDSHGLILLTNDGRIVNKILNPRFEHEKEYVVKVDKPINNLLLKHMATGVNIEGYQTKPAKIIQTNENTFKLILLEGKKHQIRRMTAALGYQVEDLKRTRIMNLELKDLKPGHGRELTQGELSKLLSTIGIKSD